ncbi:hypothetical protein SBDP1_780001 [Syntrophobacter sp. SbD1]|nr:hypothetical protein SBDP1_780001 [Syntrophobacter sp. SbD1]
MKTCPSDYEPRNDLNYTVHFSPPLSDQQQQLLFQAGLENSVSSINLNIQSARFQ